MRANFLLVAITALGLAGCEREEREYRPDPAGLENDLGISQSTLSPGPGAPTEFRPESADRYDENAYLLSEGKRLFSWYNCSGCHFNGGGGIGPALMDDKWVYGSEIENIVDTVREGRPNGMPSYRGKVPDEQIWQIAAYVRSLAGLTAKSASPNRNDDIHPRPAENRLPANTPVEGGMPPPPAP